MDQPKLEVAEVLRLYGEAYRQQHAGSLPTAQRRVMTAIEVCRTAALGGHVEQYDSCGYKRVFYNSCRNRHCPKCQSLARAEWIESRLAEILDCQYFHVVFTLPKEIAAIAYHNKKLVYSILSAHRPRRYAPLQQIPAVWAPKSDSFPSSTPGDKICFITRTCIVLLRAVDSRSMATSGSLVNPVFSYRSVCSRAYFDACFWKN